MVLIVPSWRYGGAPLNADPSWSQTCGFWRSNTLSQVCPDKLRVYSSGYASSACSSLGRCMRFAVTGGWWSGYIGQFCAGSDPYITYHTEYDDNVNIDCWKALADGVWSSSFTFDVYVGILNFDPGRTLYVRPASATNPGLTTKAMTVPVIAASTCASAGSNVATVTVYDDGTFTVT